MEKKVGMKSLVNKVVVLVTLLIFLSSTVFTQLKNPSRLAAGTKGESLYTTVLSIPVGTDLTYKYDGLVEIEKIGPSSFAIGSNGEFVIADTPTNRILWYSATGEKVNEVTLEEAVGISDIEIRNGEIFALDTSAVEPSVYRLNEAGVRLEKIVVPAGLRDDGLTGIKIGNTGELFFEMRDGAEFVDAKGDPISESVSALAGVKNKADAENAKSKNSSTLFVDDQKFQDIQVRNYLGGVQPLEVAENGDVFIAVTEVSSVPTIYVDETIRRYDRKGNLRGIARVPIGESYVYTQNRVFVTPRGDVYAMIARKKSLDIIKLKFAAQIQSILPVEANYKKTSESETQNLACSISRDQIMANANAYLNNRISLTTANISGTCAGRTKPRYLGTAGTYSSVSYDWGGGDSVYDYNRYMSQGFQSGDIPIYSTGVESCSKGVDCSGFVSRAFGTSTKYSTSSLPTISTTITRENLQPGDIINREGDHVVLFDSFGANGVTAWESTVNKNVDRVVKAYSDWTRLNGYTPRRYTGVCPGSFSLYASPSTVTMTRGSTATFTIYAYTNDGFRGAVNFYAINLPGNRVVSGTGFTPSSVDIRSNGSWYYTTLRISTDSLTPRGYFPVTVEGRSGSGTIRTTIYLSIL